MWTGIEVLIARASGDNLFTLTYRTTPTDFKMSATNAARNVIRQILTSYKSSRGFDKVGDKV